MYYRDNEKNKPKSLTLSRKQKSTIFILIQLLFFSGFGYMMTGNGRATTVGGFPFEWIKTIAISNNSFNENNFFALLGNFVIYWMISILIFYNGKVTQWLNE